MERYTIKEVFDMENKTDIKSVILGWAMLAGAYILGRKHGREKCAGDVKDVMLKRLIKEKEEKGS